MYTLYGLPGVLPLAGLDLCPGGAAYIRRQF